MENDYIVRMFVRIYHYDPLTTPEICSLYERVKNVKSSLMLLVEIAPRICPMYRNVHFVDSVSSMESHFGSVCCMSHPALLNLQFERRF